MMINMNKKYTSELLADFQYRLLERKKDLYEDMDNRNEGEIDEQNEVYNIINRDEIDRINIMLKSLKQK